MEDFMPPGDEVESAPTSAFGAFELPDLPLETYELAEEEDISQVQNETNGATDYAIIGTGQCGGRLAEAFYNIGYKKSLVINTAEQDLETVKLPDEHKMLIGTEGSGAGKDMRNGEAAAKKASQAIFDRMRRIFGNCDHIMVCAGAGGGTGGGSLGTIVAAAKKYIEFIKAGDPDKRVGVVMTLPTSGELRSGNIKLNARNVLNDMATSAYKKQISPLIIVDNDKIGRLYRNLSPKAFWPTVNGTVAGLFDIFNKLAKLNTEYTTFDPVDYRSIMECGGCCIMGLTKVGDFSHETAISEALSTNLEKTLLAGGFSLESSTYAGSIAVCGTQVMETPGVQDSINYGFDTVNNLVGDATLHRGLYENPNDKDSLKVYTVIGGLEPPKELMKELGCNINELWPGEG